MEPSHIHPMIVHFPIVLWLLTAASQVIVLSRGEHFAQRRFWPRASLWLVCLGTLGGIVAAPLGELAESMAQQKGFPTGPIEAHAAMALTALWIFIFVTAAQAFVYWKKIELKRGLSWVLAAAGIIGALFVLVAAYRGGHLVYDLGINIDAVTSG